MSQSFYIKSQLNSFLSLIILILTGTMHNLWIYTLCSFLQFPVMFSLKSLRTDQQQHCFKTQCTAYPQCYRKSVTPTFRKLFTISTQTHSLHFNSHVFRKQEGQQRILKLLMNIIRNLYTTSWFCSRYSLISIQNTSSSIPFKTLNL